MNDFKFDDWDEFIGYQHIWQLQCRIDNVGVIESEDPQIFQICAQEVACKILENSDSVIDFIGKNESIDDDPKHVYENILIGISMMISSIMKDNVSFWVNGFEEDRVYLENELNRFKRFKVEDLPFAPHQLQRKKEQERRIHWQIKTINKLIDNANNSRICSYFKW